MKTMKLYRLTLLVFLTMGLFGDLVGIVQAQSSDEDSVYGLCSKFPLNSRCQGYEAPVSLEQRSGTDARCLLSGQEQASDCKVLILETEIKVFTEVGEELQVLRDKKNTVETVLPVGSIQSFTYSESSKTDIGAVIAFGLAGLLAKVRRATINLLYQIPETANSNQNLVIVTKREEGRKMRVEFERITGLAPIILSVD